MIIRTLRRLFALSMLGYGFFNKCRVFFIALSRIVRGKYNFLIYPADLHLRINNVLCTVHLSDKSEDLGVVEEVLVNEEYKITEVIHPKIIVDAGANIGLSTIYFATKFPEATIYSVEPDPKTFAWLLRNAAQFKNVFPIQAALCADEKPMVFYRSTRSVSSSLRRRYEDDEEITVPGISLSGFMKSKGIEKIDIVKFDIEGGEENLFEEKNIAEKVDLFIGEVHLDLISTSQEDFLKKFEPYLVRILPLNKNRFILRASSLQ